MKPNCLVSVLLLLNACSLWFGCGSDDDDDGVVGNGAANAGGAGGEAGTGESLCPANWLSAEGEACPDEGRVCSDALSNPCEFGHFLRCESGSWILYESAPDPNCGGVGGDGSG